MMLKIIVFVYLYCTPAYRTHIIKLYQAKTRHLLSHPVFKTHNQTVFVLSLNRIFFFYCTNSLLIMGLICWKIYFKIMINEYNYNQIKN
jgi:hypothetical protein